MEKLSEHKYKGNFTFWHYAKSKYNIERPTKYCVIFGIWREYLESFSCTEFDTLDDALDEAKELNKMYSDTPKPQKVYGKNGTHSDGKGWRYKKYNWDFSDDKKFWGYAVLDMINCKFIKIVNGVKNKAYDLPVKPELRHIDAFFRGENEIPEDYQWDKRGEYDGWLQFRWGDGKNAIDYVEQETDKKHKPKVVINTEDYIEDYIEDYLPYTEDEINATEEYVDNGNSLENKNTSSSIADMLGNDNPLLKLKFNDEFKKELEENPNKEIWCE